MSQDPKRTALTQRLWSHQQPWSTHVLLVLPTHHALAAADDSGDGDEDDESVTSSSSSSSDSSDDDSSDAKENVVEVNAVIDVAPEKKRKRGAPSSFPSPTPKKARALLARRAAYFWPL